MTQVVTPPVRTRPGFAGYFVLTCTDCLRTFRATSTPKDKRWIGPPSVPIARPASIPDRKLRARVRGLAAVTRTGQVRRHWRNMSRRTLTFNSRTFLKRIGTQREQLRSTRAVRPYIRRGSGGCDIPDPEWQREASSGIAARQTGCHRHFGSWRRVRRGLPGKQSLRNIDRNGDSVFHDRLRQKENPGSPDPSRSCLCQALYLLFAIPDGSRRRGFRGSTLQFQRETSGPDSLDA